MNSQSAQSEQIQSSLLAKYQQMKKTEENIDQRYTQKSSLVNNKKSQPNLSSNSQIQSPSTNSNQQSNYYFSQQSNNASSLNKESKKYNITSLSGNFGKIQQQKSQLTQQNASNLSGIQQQQLQQQQNMLENSNTPNKKKGQLQTNQNNVNNNNNTEQQQIQQQTGKTNGLNLQLDAGYQINKPGQDDMSSPQTLNSKVKRSEIYTTNSLSGNSLNNIYSNALASSQVSNSQVFNGQSKMQQLLQQQLLQPQTQKSNSNKIIDFTNNKFESQSTKSAQSKNNYNFFSEQIAKISSGGQISASSINNNSNSSNTNNNATNNNNVASPNNNNNNSLRENNKNDATDEIHKRYSINRQYKSNVNSISSYLYNNNSLTTVNNLSNYNSNSNSQNNTQNTNSFLSSLQKNQLHSSSSDTIHQQLAPIKNNFTNIQNASGLNQNNNNSSSNYTDFSTVDVLKNYIIPNHESTKFSVKRNGIVKCYSANTNQGLIRNYNEDRVSIILNIMKPNGRSEENWPKCSFFGVYDGHGGVQCADFLRDNLHQFVIKDQNFPWNPVEAIKNGFEAAETKFLKQIQESSRDGVVDKSGSCAIVILIVGDTCYVANVGDSRAIISSEGGKNIYALSRDHKPSDELEYNRIIEAGGKVYQTKVQTMADTKYCNQGEQPYILGPHRVLPGRLSVTRTFGDIEAKMPKYNGNPKVVIPTPDIKSFKITENHEFIVLASDGIYDKLTTQEVGQCVWETKKVSNAKNIHQYCGDSVESIFKLSLYKKTLDNITVVIIGFDSFKQKIFPKSDQNNDKKAQKQQQQLLNQEQVSSVSNNNYKNNNNAQNTLQDKAHINSASNNRNSYSDNQQIQQQQQQLKSPQSSQQQYHFYRNYKQLSNLNNMSSENITKKDRDHLFSQQIDRNKLTDIYSENQTNSSHLNKNPLSGIISYDKFGSKATQIMSKKDENLSGVNSNSNSNRQNQSVKGLSSPQNQKIVGTSSTNLVNNLAEQRSYNQQKQQQLNQQQAPYANRNSNNIVKSVEKWKEDYQFY